VSISSNAEASDHHKPRHRVAAAQRRLALAEGAYENLQSARQQLAAHIEQASRDMQYAKTELDKAVAALIRQSLLSLPTRNPASASCSRSSKRGPRSLSMDTGACPKAARVDGCRSKVCET